jgi:hypothetical protein
VEPEIKELESVRSAGSGEKTSGESAILVSICLASMLKIRHLCFPICIVCMLKAAILFFNLPCQRAENPPFCVLI